MPPQTRPLNTCLYKDVDKMAKTKQEFFCDYIHKTHVIPYIGTQRATPKPTGVNHNIKSGKGKLGVIFRSFCCFECVKKPKKTYGRGNAPDSNRVLVRRRDDRRHVLVIKVVQRCICEPASACKTTPRMAY
jgi:hypothetical protein